MNYYILIIISGIIVEIGRTQRLKIREKSKERRIDKFKEMDETKINSIGNYEEKAKFNFLKNK
jgi:hypothetical protein